MKENSTTSRIGKLSSLLNRIRIPSGIILLLTGLLSTLWFLVRVIPKPSRATYPCIRATAPWASAFVIYLISLGGSVIAVKKFKMHLKAARYPLATFFIVLALGFSFMAMTTGNIDVFSAEPEGPGLEPANTPMGIGKGIFPGRVVWVYDPDATNEDCTNTMGDGYFTDENTDQAVVDKMVEKAVKSLTGESSIAGAWDAIFQYHNEERGKGAVGYDPSEIIFLKINCTSTWAGNITNSYDRVNNSYYAVSETSPQLILTVLSHLINEVGVPQDKIYVGDPMKSIYQDNYTKWHDAFPDVHYLDNYRTTMGREPVTVSATATIDYSDNQSVLQYDTDQLYTIFEEMEYMINLPTMKGHKHGGVTMFAKNHFGSQTRSGANHLHAGLVDPIDQPIRNTYGQYRVLTDLMTHELTGGKNLVYLMDALFTSDYEIDQPDKFDMAPFNGDWTSSLFISQDPVAIESVGFDFLFAEFDGTNPAVEDYPHMGAVDDYLHQAADSTNWPTGFVYDPEGDGTPNKFSYGVHEHWNNAVEMKYSRNMGLDTGIELVKVFPVPAQSVPGTSGLLSEKVNTIHVDSFNIKWFGTDMGISRLNDISGEWDTVDNSNYLLNNNVKDLAFQRTAYGHEIWAATDSGLSVVMYNVDGVTSSTTYTKSAWPFLLSDTITTVGVDAKGTRWIGTKYGMSLFWGHEIFDSIKYYLDADRAEADLSEIDLIKMAPYGDTLIYVASHGGGVLRYTRSEVDGVTAASSYEGMWSGTGTNTINDLIVRGTTQYYGTDVGMFRHEGNETKQEWYYYNLVDSGLPTNNVTAVEVDSSGNIWMGTDQGLLIRAADGWYIYAESDGLIDPVINDIATDAAGRVWIATNGGVEFFDGIPGVNISPPAQATQITQVGESANQMLISWTNGEGENRVVFMKTGAGGVVAPEDGVSYTANAEFGSGDAIGDWYCVYNGSNSSITVTNLTPDTEYAVMVCEYRGEPGAENYQTAIADGNPMTLTTGPVSLKQYLHDEISIYPVPFRNTISLEMPESADYTVNIYSLSGMVLLTEQFSGKIHTLNTEFLSSGSYVIVISDGETNFSYKVSK